MSLKFENFSKKISKTFFDVFDFEYCQKIYFQNYEIKKIFDYYLFK